MALPLERLASVPITALSPTLGWDGGASACILSFPQKNVLLTVKHAAYKGRWGVALHFDPQRGVATHGLGAFNLVDRMVVGKRTVKTEEVDFAYVAVPKTLEVFDEDVVLPGTVVRSEPKCVLPGEVVAPSVDETYAFYGYTRHQPEDFRLYLVPKHETGLKFIGVVGDLLRFACAQPYHEEEEYRGCSGAPILDSHGRLVALVVEGSDDRTEIRGLDLRAYWGPVLIEAGEWKVPAGFR